MSILLSMSWIFSKRLLVENQRLTFMFCCSCKVSISSLGGATSERANGAPFNKAKMKSRRKEYYYDNNYQRNATKAQQQDLLFVTCTETKRRVPSTEMARLMALSVREVSNEVLSLASRDNHDACAEILARHIMSHGKVGYTEAERTVDEIRRLHERFMKPFAFGHLTVGSIALLAGFASFPLVFDINTVLFFNQHFVTTDVPPVDDLETTLEVGAWSWNWMEPPLGQLSFFFLCVQFATQEYKHIGLNRFYHKPLEASATRIVQKYSQFDEVILRNFCNSQKYFATKK